MSLMRVRLPWAVCCPVLLGGRGGDALGPQAVSGDVQFKGRPLDQGRINFAPAEKGQTESGAMIENGKYRIPRDSGLAPRGDRPDDRGMARWSGKSWVLARTFPPALLSGAHPLKLAPVLLSVCLVAAVAFAAPRHAEEKLNVPPPGYTALFNGKDLTGWKGLPLKANTNAKTKAARPYTAMTMPQRLKASPAELAEAQKRGDESAHRHWKVAEGVLVFDGKGQSLCTAKDYGDFELYCDWKIEAKGDSGIYVRGSPQIQIWDPFAIPSAKAGSGGLFNNQKNPKEPLVMADKPIGEWNTFWIKIVVYRVTVKLNNKLVTDNVTMENFWERDKPLYPTGTIELQNHGNTLYFRNIFIKEP